MCGDLLAHASNKMVMVLAKPFVIIFWNINIGERHYNFCKEYGYCSQLRFGNTFFDREKLVGRSGVFFSVVI